MHKPFLIQNLEIQFGNQTQSLANDDELIPEEFKERVAEETNLAA